MLGLQEIGGGIGQFAVNQLQDSGLRLASPTFFVTYKAFISNGFSLGITAGIQSLQGSSIYSNLNAQMMPFDYNQTNYTVAAEGTFMYSSRGVFQAYGIVGLGLLHWTERDIDQDNTRYIESGNKFTYQLTPIGIRIGRTIGVFGELGYGYKGIFHGGISYQGGWGRSHSASPAKSY